MTVTLESPELYDAPVRGGSAQVGSVPGMLGQLHRLLDGLLALEADTLTGPAGGGGLHGLLGEADRAIRRLERFKLQIVAAGEAADVASGAGLLDTGAWVARHTNTGGAAASGVVKLARDLHTLPETSDALGEGTVRTEHAQVIAHTMRQLPPTLDARQRGLVEHKLLGWASEIDPALLRKKARSVLIDITTREEAEHHHAHVLVEEEQQALAKTRLTLHDNTDGTLTGHFTIPTLAGSLLKKVLQQLCSPRRQHPTHPGGPGAGQTPHAMGIAFTELLEHLPTDHLHHKVAATIVVTLQHHQLLTDLAAAGLDTADEISPSQARRLACNAGILPAVLNGQSLPLDLGRTHRFFTPTQRLALATTHTHCAANNCDRPYAWCELHHHTPWTHHGPTNLNQAIPLCGPHHQQIHHPNHTHTRHPNGTITITRRC